MSEGTSGGQLVQTLLLKQGHLELVVQDNVPTAFEDLQEDFITSPGSLRQCSITLTAKKCLLMFRGNLCYSVCALSVSDPTPGHH